MRVTIAHEGAPAIVDGMTAPLSQLQVFLAVARLSSFSAAARELRVSTSAVSQSVRQLEEQLRVTLLVRTTRSVSLTDEGRRLVEGAGPALGQAHRRAHPGLGAAGRARRPSAPVGAAHRRPRS